jgi:hypothetical protein
METIIRVRNKTENFSIIDNRFVLDKNLSFKAKGILVYLLTRPNDWKVYIAEIASHSVDGIDSVKSGLKELKEAGYVVHRVVREKGKIIAHEYIVYETPLDAKKADKEENTTGILPEVENPLLVEQESKKPQMEKPQVGKPLVANPVLLNTDNILSTDIELNTDNIKSSQSSQSYKKSSKKQNENNDGTDVTDFDFQAYEIIKERIDFESFLPEDKKILEAAITGLLAGDFDYKKPRVIVKSILEKLDYWSVERALDNYRRSEAEKITKPKNYFQQCLLNAAVEHELETGRFCTKLQKSP